MILLLVVRWLSIVHGTYFGTGRTSLILYDSINRYMA